MEIKKNNKTYEFDVVAKLTPAPAGLSKFYYSKVEYFIAEDVDLRKRLNNDFGETWGKTKEEANEKMEKKVREWVNKNG